MVPLEDRFAFQAWGGGWAFTHSEEGGGIAYFAHIGGFLFGRLAVKAFAAGRPPQLQPGEAR